MRRLLGMAVCLLFIVASVAFSKDSKDDPAASFKKDYPAITFESIEPTNIDGLYEVVAGNNVIYYHPKTGNIFFGEIITKGFVNITAEKRNKLVSTKLTELPLNKAIRIGRGKNIVVEFTDIDCPYCRKLEEFFGKREDVTRYVFLFPLQQLHPSSMAKSMKVLCAKENDRAAAYADAMQGSLDELKPGISAANDLLSVCNDQKALDLLMEYQEFGKKLGVQGTPALWINNTPVMGMNIPQIEQLLAPTK